MRAWGRWRTKANEGYVFDGYIARLWWDPWKCFVIYCSVTWQRSRMLQSRIYCKREPFFRFDGTMVQYTFKLAHVSKTSRLLEILHRRFEI
jgi:hypothetical protein